MSEEYNKGKEIGELLGEVKSLRNDLKSYIDEQRDINEKMDGRLTIAEQWIQTTTGKVIVLTFVFGIIGSICYIAVNWVIGHYGK